MYLAVELKILVHKWRSEVLEAFKNHLITFIDPCFHERTIHSIFLKNFSRRSPNICVKLKERKGKERKGKERKEKERKTVVKVVSYLCAGT